MKDFGRIKLALTLMYITNSPDIAVIVENAGVDWVFVDLEKHGKKKRQKDKDTVISNHSVGDVNKVKKVLNSSRLLVRINPLYPGSSEEIEKVLAGGADILMLPFFKGKSEVESFLELVRGRSETCLLLETVKAVNEIDGIIALKGIDFIHIGLNDLHIDYKKKFMFELLADGTVERLCSKFRKRNMFYGFGGIAGIGQGILPAENIIAEHYRIGSRMAILSRSFCNVALNNDKSDIEKLFMEGVFKIREYEKNLPGMDLSFFQKNKEEVAIKVNEIIQSWQ